MARYTKRGRKGPRKGRGSRNRGFRRKSGSARRVSGGSSSMIIDRGGVRIGW